MSTVDDEQADFAKPSQPQMGGKGNQAVKALKDVIHPSTSNN